VGVTEDLDQLEKSIRQLQIEWEKFFGAVEKKPPNELRARVERMLREYGNQDIRNNTERFRCQTLTARYNTMNELWNKKLRALEEGKPLGVHGLKADQLPPPPAPREEAHPSARSAAVEVRVRGESDLAGMNALFERFVEARRHTGEGAVKFDSFQKLIAQQTSRILKEKGGQAVEFRLETKDGKVSLKAKLVR
jgi:hypothetical protein